MGGYRVISGRSDFRGGKNILASEHLQYIEEGGTLDAARIGDTYLPVGTPLMRDTTTGYYVVYADAGDATAGYTLPDGYDNFCIMNIDVDMDGTNNVFVGELIIRGSVYDAKLPDTVTDAFRDGTSPLIRYVTRI